MSGQRASAYSSEIGEVGHRYLRELVTVGGRLVLRDPHDALPDTFRWHELFDRLVAAAGLDRPSERIGQLLAYNNRQVELRREAAILLREAGALFRSYETQHLAKIGRADDVRANPTPEFAQAHDSAARGKAQRNAEIATRIEAFLGSVHQ